MLKTPRCRSPEHEDRCCQHGGRQRPSHPPSHRPQCQAANEQVGMNHQVEGNHRWPSVEPRPYHEDRREDQRLWVRDAGMAAVMIRIPERHAAGMHRRGQEPEECIRLVLGVPGHDGVGHDPLAGGGHPHQGNGCRGKARTPQWTRPQRSCARSNDRPRIEHTRPTQMPKVAACHPSASPTSPATMLVCWLRRLNR